MKKKNIGNYSIIIIKINIGKFYFEIGKIIKEYPTYEELREDIIPIKEHHKIQVNTDPKGL